MCYHLCRIEFTNQCRLVTSANPGVYLGENAGIESHILEQIVGHVSSIMIGDFETYKWGLAIVLRRRPQSTGGAPISAD
jgi:hypothetical protein